MNWLNTLPSTKRNEIYWPTKRVPHGLALRCSSNISSRYAHVNPYGTFQLDMNARLALDMESEEVAG